MAWQVRLRATCRLDTCWEVGEAEWRVTQEVKQREEDYCSVTKRNIHQSELINIKETS